jgi:hypothetical protein
MIYSPKSELSERNNDCDPTQVESVSERCLGARLKKARRLNLFLSRVRIQMSKCCRFLNVFVGFALKKLSLVSRSYLLHLELDTLANLEVILDIGLG